MSGDACRICGNERGNRPFTATEMMLGLRERFDYLECGACGALQIRRVPADLARYYAPPYYAFEPPRAAPAAKRWLMRRMARHALGLDDPLGRALAALRGRHRGLGWVARAGLGLDAAILDVGAGAGQILVSLRDYGFRHLLGADPFLDGEVRHAGGVRVLPVPIEAVDGRFDLIMFHHSFEHVPDPAATLAAARARLTARGRVLVRTPIASESWRVYGEDWVELDAPRHLHVHTPRSLELVAHGAGLAVEAVEWDTTGFELWGSEQYRRGIPLADPRSHGAGGAGTVFPRRSMRAFEARARELNRTERAGRGAFWLRRKGSHDASEKNDD